MATVLDLITAAHVNIAVIRAGCTLGSDMATFGFQTLNRMLDSWAAEQLAVYGLEAISVTLTGAANYAVSPRPIKIESASTIDASGVETALEHLTAEQYAAILDKSMTGAFARAYFYDDGYPTGNVYLTPKPSSGTLLLRCIKALAAFGSTGTSVSMPSGYERAIVTCLAAELCPAFEKPVHPALATQAASAKDLLFRKQADILGLPSTLAVPAQKG